MKKKLKEAEILSVSAGNTYEFILNHLIHACPNDRDGFRYRSSTFITFRESKVVKWKPFTKLNQLLF
jgi:hypothetical protein